MSPDSEEKWVPLESSDLVFHTGVDGDMVVHKSDRGMFGGVVRRRDGTYMKRTNPLVILSPDLIRHLAAEKLFERGSNFA